MKRLLCVTVVVLFTTSAFTQSRNFLDITKLDMQNSGVITKERDVIGYYMFYSIGKVKKGQRNFALRILDENLNDVNSITFLDSKTQNLQGGLFNGENILMRFYDARNNIATYKFFDMGGNNIAEEKKPVFYDNPGGLYAVPGHGFANYITDFRNDNYTLEFFSNPLDGHSNSWLYTFAKSTTLIFGSSFISLFRNVSKRP